MTMMIKRLLDLLPISEVKLESGNDLSRN